MKKAVLILSALSLILLSACNIRFGTPKATPLPDSMPLAVMLENRVTAALEVADAGQVKEETFDDPDAPRERTLTVQETEYTFTYKHSVRAADGTAAQAYSVNNLSIPLTVLYRPDSDDPYGASLPAVIVPVNLRTVKADELITALEKLLGDSLPEEVRKLSCAVTRNDDAMTEFLFYEQIGAYRHAIAALRYVGNTVTLTLFEELPDQADIAVLLDAKDELWEKVKAAVPAVEETGDPYVFAEQDGPVLTVTYQTEAGTYRYRLYQE
ncbi:MAG: hypothetical protein J6X30_01045 [Clostridia bacterium]|nr:hypothetical protein [Clostridia bacterium]